MLTQITRHLSQRALQWASCVVLTVVSRSCPRCDVRRLCSVDIAAVRHHDLPDISACTSSRSAAAACHSRGEILLLYLYHVMVPSRFILTAFLSIVCLSHGLCLLKCWTDYCRFCCQSLFNPLIFLEFNPTELGSPKENCWEMMEQGLIFTGRMPLLSPT